MQQLYYFVFHHEIQGKMVHMRTSFLFILLFDQVQCATILFFFLMNYKGENGTHADISIVYFIT